MLLKEGYYYEKHGDRTVISLDCLLRLLELRNRKKLQGKHCLVPAALCDVEKLHKWREWARQVPYVYTASVLHNDNQPRASFVDTRTPASKDYQIGGHNRKSTRAKKRMSEVDTLDKAAEKRVKSAASEIPDQQRKELHVSKDQLVEIVRAYLEEHEDLSTQVDQPAISNMVVGDKHGDKRSLRWEVGEWFSQEGLLDDEALQHILTEPIAGFRWVAASAVPPAAQRPAAPATSARGWKTSWNDMWGWVYRNTAGVRRLLDPERT